MRLWAAALMLLALLPGPLRAQPVSPSPAYADRARQLFGLLQQPGDEQRYFAGLFLDAVPVDNWRALTAELRARHGRPVALGSVSQQSATAGQVEIRYEKAVLGFSLVIAPAAPHRVVGLRIVGVRQLEDDMDRLVAEIAALPGQSAFAVARLDKAGPQWIAAHRPDAAMAIGSSFKLILLAELARAVEAGERRWDDVVPLSHKSFSGRLAAWPDQAPMTLHSLATAMIAESDNSAADTLLMLLGRERVGAMLERATQEPAVKGALPLLSTVEAFALKMPGKAELRRRYSGADTAGRLALLQGEAAQLTAAAVDVGAVSETPVAIDSIEWFASPRQAVRLLDWLRRNGGAALPIMAVNPGIGPADAQRWQYLGYKGGSEPGVIAMNFLTQGRDGHWYAVSGSWNDGKARVDEARFVALMTRAVNLLAP